jgi:hypothetical protein
MDPSDLTTTSFGELSGLPSNRSRITVRLPSCSVRVTRRVPCSQVTSRPWSILGVAVGVVRRFAEYDDEPRLFLPLHDSIIGKVTPQQMSAATEPDWSFRPAHSASQAFDCRIENAVFGKARIEHFDGRIRISFAWQPARFKHKVKRRKGGSYPLQHLYGHFGLVRMCRLGHNVPWVKA